MNELKLGCRNTNDKYARSHPFVTKKYINMLVYRDKAIKQFYGHQSKYGDCIICIISDKT